MHGYKYALLGDVAFALLGFVLTLLFLPHVKPARETKAVSLEEGGVASSKDEDGNTETDVQLTPADTRVQKQELEESYQKQEISEAFGDKEEVLEEQGMTVAKVQFA